MGKWDKVKTKHGYKADEVISAVQKEIRRGKVHEAMVWTYELISTSEELGKKLWERLITISVEDVGFADPHAIVLISTLKKEYYAGFDKLGDQIMLPMYAAAYLASRRKSRFIDQAKHYIRDVMEEKDADRSMITIPDYAIDQHTAKGQKMGRGMKHFGEEGARLADEVFPDELDPVRHLTYKMHWDLKTIFLHDE